MDFGQYVMRTEYKKNVRVYFFCMTLSFSRMKFTCFSVDPFDIKKTIDAHIAAFKYFDGRPQMIVYDQDKVMVVSENLGEVIFVKEFEDFIKVTGFTIYLCKGNVITFDVEVHYEPTIEEVLLDEYKDYEISSIFFKRLR